ncbi:hypothetical protein DM860_009185 [Cuscuta australis]|uniref:Reverse transcriptase zinc-binding domain-containing protein n=1 Tax=Cuscuta australis TaxID=267555 RepID=A0A328DDT3_9ASTE|nr:hypothetical protein DM860_009185 [Cuscuta australis]
MRNTGNYSPDKGYQWLLGQKQNVKWRDLVWNKLSIPKHKFIMSLLCKNILQTKVRLSKMFDIDTTCPLCKAAPEDAHHLFCKCPFTEEAYNKLHNWCLYSFKSNNLNELFGGVKKAQPGKKRRKLYSILAATIYFVWKACNRVVHQGLHMSSEEITQQIKFHVDTYMRSKIGVK